MSHWLRPAIATVALAVGSALLGNPPRIETGELGPARFALARPERWNRGLLLLAPGLRPEERPLVAELFPDHAAHRALLEAGWMIATTSYRRNGLIVADAIADLDALREHIAETYGRPVRVVLQGESMGGLIVTHLAEREPLQPAVYHGAIAIGAALHLREPNSRLGGLTLQPRIPLVFLANRSEIDAPSHYVTADVPRLGGHIPVLLRVSRDGHVNVNQAERLAAFRILDAWLENGRHTVPPPAPGGPFVDVTVAPQPKPSAVVRHPDGRGFDARVIEVSAAFGNLFIDAQPEDFAAAGIERMTWFQLKVGTAVFRVFHGRDFNSVKRAEWVSFPNADGYYWLVRNFADAAATARLQVGSAVTLRRFPAATNPSAPAPEPAP
jgi:pimeloyl-ACP methyl ester carboxylesterase